MRAVVFLIALLLPAAAPAAKRTVVLVHPGDDVQRAVDHAASREPKPVVRFAPGVYAPPAPGQALLHLTGRHDGLTLEADGDVTLTAANESAADRAEPSYPAVVNHVLLFGDGISHRTVVRGFRITGARGYLTKAGEAPAAPGSLDRNIVYYSDGGGIKVFGDSAPVLENLTVEDNLAFFCGGGLSVEQAGLAQQPVVVRHSRFRRNRAPLTGGAIDVLPGSRLRMEDTVLDANEANFPWLPVEELHRRHARQMGFADFSEDWNRVVDFSRFANSAAMTIFAGSSVLVDGGSFTGNSAGVNFSPYTSWYWKGRPAVAGARVEIRRALFSGNVAYDVEYPSEHGCEISLGENHVLPGRAALRDRAPGWPPPGRCDPLPGWSATRIP